MINSFIFNKNIGSFTSQQMILGGKATGDICVYRVTSSSKPCATPDNEKWKMLYLFPKTSM